MSIHPMNPQHDREIGILRTEVDHIKEDVKEIKGDVKTLLHNQSQRDGSKKTLAIIASIVSAVISVAVSVISKLF